MKRFNLKYNVGKVKYLVSYHNGKKKHKDGSDFFDIACFKNKVKLNAFIDELLKQGYSNCAYDTWLYKTADNLLDEEINIIENNGL